ncbi:hypothetical protein SAMN00790413_01866 [Deinococcus hopiensis KR-140]|uniref:Glycine zipper-like domain-containing protein n=2 Tax=Deinococcus TaxID=1298 RepID=A0A1W1VIJ9_9DEIO|nr:hypothetical protein SAMN00790413_01866 [Deinococcus hopiensis KR-140]
MRSCALNLVTSTSAGVKGRRSFRAVARMAPRVEGYPSRPYSPPSPFMFARQARSKRSPHFDNCSRLPPVEASERQTVNLNLTVLIRHLFTLPVMKTKGQAIGFWMAIGVGVGVAIGAALHNIGIGISMGIALGVAVGALVGRNLP